MMGTRKWDMLARLFLALLVVASSGACGTNRAPLASRGVSPAATASDIEGEWWLVTGYGSDGEIHVRRAGEAYMLIEGPRISGTAICNHYDGKVKIEGSSFDAPGFSVTEMGCLPAKRGQSERAFLTALHEVERFVRQGDRLILTGPATELRFRFHPQPPPPTLVGTRWKLNALVEGRGSYGMASSVQSAWLLLRERGTMLGTSGCRRFRALWKVVDGRVQVTSFGTQGDCVRDTDQDAHVIKVLSSGFSFEIREQSLDLYELGGDTGLSYTTGLR